MSEASLRERTEVEFAPDAGQGRRLVSAWGWALASFWTLAVMASLGWGIYSTRASVISQARSEADAAIQKDLSYRQVVSTLGGLYAPADRVEPNPFLEHVPERDVVTADGRRLTLLNSSYFTRIVHDHEAAQGQNAIRGHATSMRPLRPANAPDSWEAGALEQLKQGAAEVAGVMSREGRDYFRLMRPRFLSPSCLRCHEGEGRKPGDVFGGISVSVPLERFWEPAHRRGLILAVGHGSLWIIGLAGLGISGRLLRKRDDALRRSAYYDALTGLPNRTLLLDRLQLAIANATRHGRTGAVLFIDLDHFKTINESLGHSMGDGLIREVAVRLRELLRRSDTLARTGGDEFVVVLTELNEEAETAAGEAQRFAERVRDVLTSPFTIEGRELHTTPSIGIALFPIDAENGDDVLKQADTAMFRAKERGRNLVRFFRPSMQHAASERLAMHNGLRHALGRGELTLRYQPQVAVTRGQIIGAEALLRWYHPVKGLISPAQFIPVAEETGLIIPIGEWVLRTACQQMADWRPLVARSDFRIAVNVSPRQFRQKDFVERVIAILDETGADPRRLELELTEGTLVDNVEDAVAKMKSLKDWGVRFAIDDFGTGYSSLAYLKQLPIDVLKIDKSFIDDITTDPNDMAIVETILAMAWRFEIDVVAEGVENQAQLDFLRIRVCDAYQGYLFSPPTTPDEIQELLAGLSGTDDLD